MKSIDLTSEFLALGCNRGKIFIFCMKTRELVRFSLSLKDGAHKNKDVVFNVKSFTNL